MPDACGGLVGCFVREWAAGDVVDGGLVRVQGWVCCWCTVVVDTAAAVTSLLLSLLLLSYMSSSARAVSIKQSGMMNRLRTVPGSSLMAAYALCCVSDWAPDYVGVVYIPFHHA